MTNQSEDELRTATANQIQQWYGVLRCHGYHLTPARRTVVATIVDSGGPFNAPHILACAQKKQPGLGLATIYRTLDILAAALPRLTGKLMVVAEAGRTRVCAGLYEWQGRAGWQATATPDIETWTSLLVGLTGPATFAGEITPAGAKLIRGAGKGFRIVPVAASVRRAGYLAEIGWQRLKRGELDDAAALSPIYLRDPAGAIPS